MNKKIVSKCNPVKGVNHKRILQLIRSGEERTKLDIAYKLKISIPTVTVSINELAEAGFIQEIENDKDTLNIKLKVIKLKENAKVSIGISIAKNKVSVVVMNLASKVLLKKEKDYTTKVFIEYIEEAKLIIDELLDELKISMADVLGVGISVPGTINKALNMAEHTNIGFKDVLLSDIYNLFDCSVYIENEANLSLVAEKTINGYEKDNDLIYIGINEGLGGGIYVNGALFTGVNGRAGEFGHIYLDTDASDQDKSVEDYISTLGLVRRYNGRTCVPISTFEEFKSLVEEKDYAACEVLNEGIEVLMLTIYNLTIIFDIQKIIVGGKVGRLIKNQNMTWPIGINKYKKFVYKMDVDVIFSDVQGTTVLGAAMLPLIDFYKISYETK